MSPWLFVAQLAVIFVGWAIYRALALLRKHEVWPRALASSYRRALLVIAHPDDEAMFFVPAVRAMRAAGVEVGFLCLSNGSGGGHGPTRTAELYASARALGVNQSLVWVADHPELQDGMRNVWPDRTIAGLVEEKVAAHGFDMVRAASSAGSVIRPCFR